MDKSDQLTAPKAEGTTLYPRILTNAGEERLITLTDPVDLPPLEIPQPTEPLHIGRTFSAPGRWASRRRDPGGFLHRLLLAVALLLSIVMTIVLAAVQP